jgi:hypothetical protein
MNQKNIKKDGQFNLKVYDYYWTSDTNNVYSKPIKHNPIELIKKLVELGVTTYDELGL